jgi:uncharacterized membrane protein
MTIVGIPQEVVYILIIIVIGVIFTFVFRNSRRQRREQIDEQVQRMETANDPNYQRPNDGMYATIEDGVIKYRRKKRDRSN